MSSFEAKEIPVKTQRANIKSELKNALTKQIQMKAEMSEISVVASTSEDDVESEEDKSSADDMSDLNYDTCLNKLINEGVECSKNISKKRKLAKQG